MTAATPVIILGQDGVNLVSPTNPLATSQAASTATIGSATIIGALPAGTNAIGTTTVAAITAALPTGANVIGFVQENPTQTAVLSQAILNFSASGTTNIVNQAAGQSTKVYRIFFTNTTATTVDIQDGPTTQTGPLNFAANGQFILPFATEPYLKTSANATLTFKLSATSQISGIIYYKTN